MPQITVKQPFLFAHHGYQVEAFELGAAETTEECASLAIAQGWAVAAHAEKASPAAPENKDAAPKRRTKAAD